MKYATTLLITSTLILGACGGGGGEASVPPTPSPPPPPPPATVQPSIGNNLPGPRPVAEAQDYVNFESGQVRPLALSRDGSRLFAVNTPDGRLEIFAVGDNLSHLASVPVGIDPVALAEGPAGNVWVVNHLSDSVSIVNVDAAQPHVIQTLWVGDEPRDIVFAGPDRERAFITTAHRGQNSPVDPGLETPGIGRADVWVFDSTALTDSPGGQALDVITLFGDRPRPLAVSGDGLRVFAGIFLSGNRTTVIGPPNIPKAAPSSSADDVPQPDTGLILRFDGENWVDETGRTFNGTVPFSLPDYDVFEIDAVGLNVTRQISGVGTTLFNIAVNPVNDILYVSNLDARNHIRFAGPATRATSSVRGHLTDQGITVITAGDPQRRVLNKHIDFTRQTGSQQERDLSVSTPLGMAVSADGATLYLASFGTSKIVKYSTAELLDNSFFPNAQTQAVVSGGGPSGVVLDEMADRAYVLTRFDNAISTIDLNSMQETDHITMFSPEPASVTEGRRFLYDATTTSGNGNDSCASCHIFGDTDGLAWDLGEPDGEVAPIPNVFIPISNAAAPVQFHPMKGPMTTQSMRGLRGHGPMHWRGDRTGSNRVGDETLEEAAFKEFNDAFDALQGLGAELPPDDMQAFTDFGMRISYPPNPIRQLDNQLAGIEIRGEEMFENGVVRVQTGVLEVCVRCHTLDHAAGLFGTKGLSSDNIQPGERNFKIPHFRDQYQKVGMFGWGFRSPPATGPQVRGFGFNHNGATSSNYMVADLGMPADDLSALRAFLYRFPTESAPVLGQSITLTSTNKVAAAERLDLLLSRANIVTPIPECDLVATGVIGGIAMGWSHARGGLFHPDTNTSAPIDRAALEDLVVSAEDRLTFTCTPWGSGVRIGIDRDLDGVLNRDE